MKCPKCGAETNGKFCSYCGADLQNTQSMPDQQPAVSQQQQRQAGGYTYGPGSLNTQTTSAFASQSRSPKKKHSGMAIGAFVLSFLGPLSFIGIILAIIDLIKDKTNSFKHGLSIAAIVIGGIMLLIFATSANSSKTDVANNASSTTSVEKTVEADNSSTDISIEEKSESTEEAVEEVAESTEDTEQTTDSSIEESNSSSESESIIEEPSMSKEEFIATCTELNYKAIAREPDKYIGQNFYFTCYVSDVRESGLLSGNQKYYVTYAFDMDKAQDAVKDGWADDLQDAKYHGMDYDICVWVMDNRNESDPNYIKVLDDDIITVYGTFTGMTETKNSLTKEKGEQVSLDVKYVDLLAE